MAGNACSSDARRKIALGKEQTKIRVLQIYFMLNSGCMMSVPEIIARLKSKGIDVDRKTVYSDIYAIDKVVTIEIVGSARYTRYKIAEQKWR